MEDLNAFCFSGNLVKDSEVKNFNSSAVLNFTVACNRSKKVEGEWVEVPSFFDVTYWTKGAEKMAAYLKKGTSVAVQGRIEQQSWTDKDGNKHSKLVVIADTVKWSVKREGGQTPAQASAKIDDSGFPEDVF